jgi:transcriptional regulator with XRE-family HTH domain
MTQGEKFRAKRDALGVSQAEAARYFGVSTATISKFENGGRLSKDVYRGLKDGMEDFIRQFDHETYQWIRLKQEVASLELQDDKEKLWTLSHMITHVGKLMMDIQDRLKEKEKKKEEDDT